MAVDLTIMTHRLALAGVRLRHPSASPEEQQRLLRPRILGEKTLARTDRDLVRLVETQSAVVGKKQRSMAPATPYDVLIIVAQALDSLNVRYAVVGSIASSIHGDPRSTNGIDIVVDLREGHVAAFRDLLDAEFFVDLAMMDDATARRASFNVIHRFSPYKVDIFVAGAGTLDMLQLAHATAIPLTDDASTHIQVASAMDTVLAKLVWYQLGNEVSDRQWRDIVSIVKVQGPALDKEYLQRQAVVLGVDDLLARALADGGA